MAQFAGFHVPLQMEGRFQQVVRLPSLKAISPKRTSQLIAAEVEPGQLDTLARLAGDFACQRKWKVFQQVLDSFTVTRI
jgi:hypothetical protein